MLLWSSSFLASSFSSSRFTTFLFRSTVRTTFYFCQPLHQSLVAGQAPCNRPSGKRARSENGSVLTMCC